MKSTAPLGLDMAVAFLSRIYASRGCVWSLCSLSRCKPARAGKGRQILGYNAESASTRSNGVLGSWSAFPELLARFCKARFKDIPACFSFDAWVLAKGFSAHGREGKRTYGGFFPSVVEVWIWVKMRFLLRALRLRLLFMHFMVLARTACS